MGVLYARYMRVIPTIHFDRGMASKQCSYRTNVDPDFACRTDKVHCIRQSNYLTVFTQRDYESGKDFDQAWLISLHNIDQVLGQVRTTFEINI